MKSELEGKLLSSEGQAIDTKFREKLDHGLAQRWHDIGRVPHSQTTDRGDGQLANLFQGQFHGILLKLRKYLKDFVIQGDKERAEVFGLCKMMVKLRIQARQNCFTNGRI
jgi:hypothetical protein